MKYTSFATYAEMSAAAADIVAAQLRAKPASVLGLATGSTPIGMYDRLAELHKAGALDFSLASSVNLDEYIGLPPTHDQSYRFFMNKYLFSRVNIPIERTNVPSGVAPDPDAECARYDALIESLGGTDIQVLGIGVDGHIGFNEPADAFSTGTNCVDLDPSTIEANARFFASADDVPRRAITMGMSGIMGSRHVLLLAAGPAKKDILERSMHGPVTPRVPASILQFHPNVTVLFAEKG